jgi:glycosyltransferase involved in cell wall biosynthesis
MRTPSVSVVIPTFNRAHSVGKAIESVLAQTFQDFEVIVVDDGSKDDTSKVLAGFGDGIRTISQENRGASAARNAGIRLARGKWVAFLDSDDEWHPTKLKRQVDCLEKLRTKVCFARCVTERGEPVRDIDDLGLTAVESGVYCVPDALDLICRLDCHPLLPSLVVERQLLERTGLFDESLYVGEDTRLIYNLAFLAGFAYVDEPLVVIHQGTDHSLSYDPKPESARKRYSSYLRVQAEAYWRMLEVSPEKASVLRRRLSYFVSRRAELACAANQLGLARAIAKDGILFAGDFRTFVRCLGLYVCPVLFRSRLVRKWYKGNATPDSVATQPQGQPRP